MTRFLLPIFIIGFAAVIFFVFTDPLINAPLEPATIGKPTVRGGILALREEKDRLNQALTHARELSKKLQALTAEYNNLSPDKVERLDLLLPDTVDNVQLIIDTNDIAKIHGMSIKNVRIKTEEEQKGAAPRTNAAPLPPSRPGSMEQGSVGLEFVVTGPYHVFQEFLVDLARSLRVVEVMSAAVAGSDREDNYQYSVELKTHWLK